MPSPVKWRAQSDSQCPFHGPATGQSCVEDGWPQAIQLSPIHETTSFAAEVNPSVVPGVSGLLMGRCPSHIARLITALVVNSINAISGTGLRPYVLEERLEIVSPFRRNRNPSAAIVMIGQIIRIVTPLYHSMPSTVLRSFSLTMPEVSSFHSLPPPAAAGDVTTEIGSGNGFDSSAVAKTFPNRSHPVMFSDNSNCRQATESLPSFDRYGRLSRHDRLPFSRLCLSPGASTRGRLYFNAVSCCKQAETGANYA